MPVMLSALRKQLHKEHRAGRSQALLLPAAAPTEVAEDTADPPPLTCAEAADDARLEAVRTSRPRLHDSLRTLDGAQLAAVLSDEESLLVRAPVGSGKTTVLCHKVLYLHFVCGVPLRQMVVLTFTNRAAAEIRARLEAIAERPLPREELWLIGTFHGVARALLSRVLPVGQLGYGADFTVLDQTEQEELLTELIRSHRLRIGRRSTLRQRLRELGDGQAEKGGDLARLATLLTQEKKRRNAMDFDDLIAHATALLPELGAASFRSGHTDGLDGDLAERSADPGAPLPPRWLIVDEMQDCEPRELALLQRLRGATTRFFAVGDPHQAIYGFRGSAPEVFSQAEAAFRCRSLALPRNYRSTRTIVDGARAVLGLQPAASRGAAGLSATRSFGEPLLVRRHHDPISEALYLTDRIAELHRSGVPYRELAVLFRLRAQAEPIRAALTARQIPCSESEPEAEEAGDAVRLLTLHAAKGLEFRQVFLSGINDGLLPLGHRFDIGADAEERRLLFVGLTRARDRVEISYHSRPHEAFASAEPSPYLACIPAALVTWDKGSASLSQPAITAPDRPTAAAAPASEPPAPAASPWQPGQQVRHARYGAGVVLTVASGTVHCSFGKLGERSFPLTLCPLLPSS